VPDIQKLLERYQIVSDQITHQQLRVLLQELDRTLRAEVPGEIVELGCYVGTTSVFIQRLLDEMGDAGKHRFHVYDSFAGLPGKGAQDASPVGLQFKAGELSVSKRDFIKTFQRAHMQLPEIHKAWFKDLTAADMPSRVAFAFLDGDFYDSILTSLQLVWARMQPGGRILIDDFQREALPGVERATYDFFRGKPLPRLRKEHNIAIIEL
jgi:Macrocin-O-methyltransferase (TylF)